MSEIPKNKINILRYFTKRYPLKSFNLLIIQFFTGFIEGLGIAALFPLIDALINQQAGDGSPLQKLVAHAFAFFGIELSFLNILIVISVLFSVKAVLRYAGAFYATNLSSKIVMDFRENLVRALLKSEWPFYIRNPTGYFTNALMVEAQRSGNCYRILADMFAAFLQMLILLIIAIIASWKIMVAGLIVSIILWLALFRFIKQSGQAGLEQKDMSKAISAQITDLLNNYKPLKAMHIETHVFERIRGGILKLFVVSRRQVMAKQSMVIFHEPLFIVMFCVGLYLAITFLETETTTLMVFAAIFYRFVSAWKELQQGYQALSGQESFFWSFQNFTAEAQNAKEEYVPGQEPELTNNIAFENVTFSYHDRTILSGLNLEFPAHKLIGLFGPSGTGKTTILDLICRLYSPQQGAVLIDGNNIQDFDLYLWRNRIGYVPQEFVIFNESLFHNITLGAPDISEDQVIQALKQAEAWEFVRELPEGLSSNLGERGAKLSGGQRQRISIARALVRKPMVLILDEATASLDPVTELEIFKTLKNLTSETTIIAVSHQQEIKRQADVLIDLQNV